jgi:hypothetical protein
MKDKFGWEYCTNKEKWLAIHPINHKLYELYWQDSRELAQKEAISRFGRGTKIVSGIMEDLKENDFMPAD